MKNTKSGKKKNQKHKPQSQLTYPSQYMKVGGIHCIFFRYFYKGKSPLFTLGPDWNFTLFLLFFALCVYTFIMVLCFLDLGTKLTENAQQLKTLSKVLCNLNIILLLMGILKNPGIPQKLFDKVLKQNSDQQERQKQQSQIELKDMEETEIDNNSDKEDIISAKTEELDESDDDEEEEDNDDIESGLQTQKQQKLDPFYNDIDPPCKHCKVPKHASSYHCFDCGVCIEDIDHHCVFFSKCIGRGNVYYFYGSIILLAINLGLTFFIQIFSLQKGDGVVKK